MTPEETNWTPPFQLQWNPKDMFRQRISSLMVDKGTVSKDKCTFCFPKEHNFSYLLLR